MTEGKDGRSVSKRAKSSGGRKRRQRSSQSVVTRVSPEAIERFASAIEELFCAIGWGSRYESLTGPEEADEAQDERRKRDRLGATYIAAIAEQRPGIAGHGYPGGQPDWDRPARLFWSGVIGQKSGLHIQVGINKSIVMPDWMALPLVLKHHELLATQDESGETDSGNIDPA